MRRLVVALMSFVALAVGGSVAAGTASATPVPSDYAACQAAWAAVRAATPATRPPLVQAARTACAGLNLGLHLHGPLGGSLGLGLGGSLGLLPSGLLNLGGVDPALSGLGSQLGSVCNFNTLGDLNGVLASRAARERARVLGLLGPNPALYLQRLRAQQQCQAELQLENGALNFSSYGFDQLGTQNLCPFGSFGAFQNYAQPLVGNQWPQVASLFGNGAQDWNSNWNQLLTQGCGVTSVPQAVPYPVPYAVPNSGQTPNIVIAPNFNAPSNSNSTAGPASLSGPATESTPGPLSNSQVSQIPSGSAPTGDGSTAVG